MRKNTNFHFVNAKKDYFIGKFVKAVYVLATKVIISKKCPR